MAGVQAEESQGRKTSHCFAMLLLKHFTILEIHWTLSSRKAKRKVGKATEGKLCKSPSNKQVSRFLSLVIFNNPSWHGFQSPDDKVKSKLYFILTSVVHLSHLNELSEKQKQIFALALSILLSPARTSSSLLKCSSNPRPTSITHRPLSFPEIAL